MGEIADMMLDGTLCQQCGGVIDGTTPGYPRTCEDCENPLDFPWAMKLIKEMISDIKADGTKKQKKSLIGYLYKEIRELKGTNEQNNS